MRVSGILRAGALALALAGLPGRAPAAGGGVRASERGLATAQSAGRPAHRPGAFSSEERAQGFRQGVVLARPRADHLATVDREERAEATVVQAVYPRVGRLRLIRTRSGESVAAAVARLQATGRYDFVEPDRLRHALDTPDDPLLSQQWALSNAGTAGGLAGCDINALQGWNTAHDAPSVVVAVLDSGVRATHQDLAANLWINPNPGQAFVLGGATYYDSLNGLNAVAGSGAPADDAGHGTHVSGIIGAVGNNALGVCGVAWKVRLMELKFLDASGEGSTSAEIACIEYAIDKGAAVISGSFGSAAASQSEMAAIQAAGSAGIVVVVAAGNNAESNDVSPDYPADYLLDNLVAVGASDNRDAPAVFSDTGPGSVDLFAPGVGILSTFNGSDSDYEVLDGTSMATPFVSGAAALLRQLYPGDTYRETINRILGGVDRPAALAGLCLTGGRLDLAACLDPASSSPVPANATFGGRLVLGGADPLVRSSNADCPQAPEPGTPQIAGTAGGRSLWWQWTAPVGGTVEIDTDGAGRVATSGLVTGSGYSTLLAVYTGSSLASLSLVAGDGAYGTTATGPGGAAVQYSRVGFHATAGTTYQINVQGQAGAGGRTVLSVDTDPDNDAFSGAFPLSGADVSVSATNENATREPGEPTILSHQGGHSLWYAWTAPASGPVRANVCSPDFVPDMAVYTGGGYGSLALVGAAAGGAFAGTYTDLSTGTVAFAAVAGVTYHIAVDGQNAAGLGSFTLTLDNALWQQPTGDAVTTSPAAGADGTVYVGGDDGVFRAIGPDGSLNWSYAAPAGVSFDTSSACVRPDGSVVAGGSGQLADGSQVGLLYAFAAGGGAPLWTFSVPQPSDPSLGTAILCSPAVGPDGSVYVHAADGNLYCLAASTGLVQWTYPVPGQSYAAPALLPDGRLVLGTDQGELLCLSGTGGLLWSAATPVPQDPIYTAAALDASGNAYVATLGGTVFAVNAATGALLWSAFVGDSITSAPAVGANGAVYFGCYDGNLHALSGADGTVLWTCPLGAQVRASAPALDASGNIYLGCYDGSVYAVSPAGAIVAAYPTAGEVRSSPLITGNTLVFGGEDHQIYAYALGAGAAQTPWPQYMGGPARPGRTIVPAWIADLSARASVGSGDAVLIAGFVIGGTGSETMVLRGIGPALTSFGVPGALAEPEITLSAAVSGQALQTGGPWAGSGLLSALFSAVGAFPLSAGSADCALAPALTPAGYTLEVAGSGGSTGVALGEIYEADGSGATATLENISARAQVGTSAGILIGGFVIGGTEQMQVLLRGVGPGLAAAPFDLAGALAQPEINLFDSGGDWLAGNAGWGGSAAVAAAAAQVGAFALAPSSADAAVLTTLSPGAYTVQLSGVGDSTGIGLVEVYRVR